MIYKISDGVSIDYLKQDSMVRLRHFYLGSEETVEISGAGPIFVSLFDGKRDMDEILGECAKIFGPTVDAYTLAKDLETFVSELMGSGMLTLVSTSAH